MLQAIKPRGLLLWMLLACPTMAGAAELDSAGAFVVQLQTVPDLIPVMATVERVDMAVARARLSGTIVDLYVDEGTVVKEGDVLALIGDEKIALQIQAVDAQIAALTAQNTQAQADLQRAATLVKEGTIARARFDDLKAAAAVAHNQLKAQQAARSVLQQQSIEGQVLAPAAGRVVAVMATKGSVVVAGDTLARIAANGSILRLQLPESHAPSLHVGDAIKLGEEADVAVATIQQIYPEITHGRVMVDATVAQDEAAFVGQRVRVWVATSQRKTFVIPASHMLTEAGIDYVYVRLGGGEMRQVPVQRGRGSMPLEDIPDGVEILSGLKQGDVLLPVGE